MQKFIAIPELGIIVRKIAPNGRHFAGFGTHSPVEDFNRWVGQCYADEDQFYWDEEFYDERARRYLRNIKFKETTCNSSS
jgi:hypothetical protein